MPQTNISMGQWWLLVVVAAAAVACVHAAPAPPASPPVAPRFLRAMIVPHSHDDVGWLETIDHYYDNYVRAIYTTNIEALAEDPRRRFISVEMAYFSKWWSEASEAQRNMTHLVVSRNQLEFVVGGWTMEDEAATTFSANIEQMTAGHAFIKSLFGEKAVPRLGWQIDPFGHSTAVHAQFADFAFEATVLDRISANLKSQMEADQDLQFVWRPTPDEDASRQIFTHVMDQYGYSTAVPGFEWDSLAPPVTEANVRHHADRLVANIVQRGGWYRSDVVLWPWGSDFQHYWGLDDFRNMDKILDYVNSHSAEYNVSVQYATLSEYFAAVHAANLTWDVRGYKDFFPYGQAHSYGNGWWTGYYTSRVAQKGFTRTMENVLRIGDVLHVLTQKPWGTRDSASDIPKLDVLRAAVNDETHHDAVAGTSEPWVVQMYLDDLSLGSTTVEVLAESCVGAMMASSAPNMSTPALTYRAAAMPSLSPGTVVPVVLLNTLGWEVTKPVHVPVASAAVRVLGPDGATPLVFDVVRALPAPKGSCMVTGTCGWPAVETPLEVVFLVTLPPLGYVTVFVEGTSSSAPIVEPERVPHRAGGTATVVSNSRMELHFSAESGLLAQVVNKAAQRTAKVAQNLAQYHSVGNLPILKNSSGAYVFHPEGPAKTVAEKTRGDGIEVLRGRVVQEVRQVFAEPCTSHLAPESCGISQQWRLYTAPAGTPANSTVFVEGHAEVVAQAGPLTGNRDLVAQFQSDLATHGAFFSDDNCLHTHARQYNSTLREPISGNYYPASCSLFTRDNSSDRTLLLVGDRSRGGSSLADGALEMMQHRRVISTDGAGPLDLDDTDHIADLTTRVVLDSAAGAARLQRHHIQDIRHRPGMLFGAEPMPLANWLGLRLTFQALHKPLPEPVHLLSLWQLSDGGPFVLRLMHIFFPGEHPSLAVPVTVDLAEHFAFARILSLDERTLNFVHPADAMQQRWTWNTADGSPSPPQPTQAAANSTVVALKPGQIRTFVVSFGANA